MSRTVREISIGTGEQAQLLYYGFCTTSDSPRTNLSPSYDFVIDQLVTREPDIIRDNLVEITKNLKPLVEISPEGIGQLQEALSTLQRGEDIPVEQKQALYHFEQFIDAVIDEKQVNYRELDSEMMVRYLTLNGLDQDLWEYVSEGDELISYLSDRITYPVYVNEAISADFEQEPFIWGEFDNMEGRRKAASMILLVKTNLAVGALFAAGTQGDGLAMAASEGIEPLLRI